MRSWRRFSCTSMSDHAESQRIRNCTRLLYIPISAKAMTTRTPKKIQAMNVFLSRRSGNQRDGTTGTERAQLEARRETVYVGRCGIFDENSVNPRRRIETHMGTVRKKQLTIRTCMILSLGTVFLSPAHAQTCLTAGDMDEPTRAALVSTAKRYFDIAARGDSEAMRQNSIASVASNFSGIETAVKDNQANFSGVQATPRPPFLLKAEGTAPFERAEFLCGVFGKSGQTSDSAVFVIPNLPPGNYAVAILDVPAKQPDTVSFVLQQEGKDWKIGGFYVKESQIAGHDASWFADHARAFKSKGQNRNAWLYYIEARDLAVPLPFMYTQLTDKLADESET